MQIAERQWSMRFRELELARPQILGAHSSTRPHMACTCCRGYPSSGCRAWPTSRSEPQFARAHFRPAGILQTAYSDNRHDAIENIVDADLVVSLVRELIADRAQWTGIASDLLQAGTRRAGWPKSRSALAGRLCRAQTFLRALGIQVTISRKGAGSRVIRIRRGAENTVSTVSSVRDPPSSEPPPRL